MINHRGKFQVLILIAIFILFFASNTLSAQFWASMNSIKYHYPSCKWAQKISKRNLIIFNSPEEAIKAGYVPCKVCKPPRSTKGKYKGEN